MCASPASCADHLSAWEYTGYLYRYTSECFNRRGRLSGQFVINLRCSHPPKAHVTAYQLAPLHLWLSPFKQISHFRLGHPGRQLIMRHVGSKLRHVQGDAYVKSPCWRLQCLLANSGRALIASRNFFLRESHCGAPMAISESNGFVLFSAASMSGQVIFPPRPW